MNIELVLSTLIENTTLIGVFFVIGGMIKVFTYYKLFGIFIFEFFDIKEVLTLFANNIFAYTIIIAYIIAMILLIPIIHFYYLVLAPIVFTVLSIIYFKLRKDIFIYEVALQNLLFWGVFLIIYCTFPGLSKVGINQNLLQYYFLVLIICSLIGFSLFNAANEYFKVVEKGYYFGTIIKFEDEEIISTMDKFYIGKTDKYIFIFNRLTKETEIIPSEKLKKITFNKK